MSRPPASLRALAVARGDEPADILLTGGFVLSPATREWVKTDLAIADGFVAGWGHREAKEVIDVSGCYLAPGFVDAHMHLESSKMWVSEYVKAVLPYGTTAVAADPHEIANVAGMEGIRALIDAAEHLPFTFGVAASSCVPESPFASAGAAFTVKEVRALIEEHGAIGVAEVMNYPAVINGDPMFRDIIATAGWRRVDGHAPGLRGPQLDAYLAAGVESDHEVFELDEAHEKRQKGMWVFLRQGSVSQDLVRLLPTVVSHGTTATSFCTDDREPDLLRDEGHLMHCVLRRITPRSITTSSTLVLWVPVIKQTLWCSTSLKALCRHWYCKRVVLLHATEKLWKELFLKRLRLHLCITASICIIFQRQQS